MKLTPAECVMEAFDGVRETARILGINQGSVSRWTDGLEPGEKRLRRSGAVPIHHFERLLAEAQARGKNLTLEHLVFGRDSATEGIVIVKDGKKVEIKMRDRFDYMTASLTMAGG